MLKFSLLQSPSARFGFVSMYACIKITPYYETSCSSLFVYFSSNSQLVSYYFFYPPTHLILRIKNIRIKTSLFKPTHRKANSNQKNSGL